MIDMLSMLPSICISFYCNNCDSQSAMIHILEEYVKDSCKIILDL